MRYLQFVFVMILVGALAGCGSGDSPKAVTPPAATDAMKATLTEVAQTGQLNSGAMSLEGDIERLRATDAAKADALKKDYDELMSAGNNPVKAKAKAQEMLGKL
jgi:hypothetical protein